MHLIYADAITAKLDSLILVEDAARGEGGIGEVERLLIEAPGTGNSEFTWIASHPARGIAVKTATVFPGNGSAGLRPNVQSVATIFDGASGAPLAAIHAESFTRMKTAARGIAS
jgi:ornithine cyclodeaminase/alanine dehydrogenase-like protein (mu-crystallin family)